MPVAGILQEMNIQERQGFWQEAVALRGSITPLVMPLVVMFGLIAGAICLIAWKVESAFGIRLGLEVAPYEFAGVVLGLLLVLRTNAGYDRWWEGRKLWGSIVNQSRNLGISAMAYGPSSAQWRDEIIRWTAVFPHAARQSLRGQRPSPIAGDAIFGLIGPQSLKELAAAEHMPSFVSLKLAELLRQACDKWEMDRFAFLQLDRERALLIDHIGACERILKTPLPKVYSVKIRRFILLFLLTLPAALLHRMDHDWVVPLITMLLAYPLLSLDQIGVELENPFSLRGMSHLPIDIISATIQRNLHGISKSEPTGAP